MPKPACSCLECLEDRIAPAALTATPPPTNKFTYTDAEGDLVAVTFTKAILTAANTSTILQVAAGNLELIDLTSLGSKAQGIGITVTAKGTTGDGLADVGRIDATGIDLGAVTIGGDLGAILAGDSRLSTAGVSKLNVYSMGRLGLAPQGGTGDLNSAIAGPLGSLTVTRDLNGEYLQVTGNIASVTIGGSLIGNSGDYSGTVLSTGAIGSVKIGRDLVGGSSNLESGAIDATVLGSVTIGGSLIGGAGTNSGYVHANGNLASIAVGRDLAGGAGAMEAGAIDAVGTVGAVRIGGSVIGGSGSYDGYIHAAGTLKSVTIGRDLTGADGSNGGFIQAANLGAVTVGGSVNGGSADFTGDIQSTFGPIGAVKIGLDLTGGAGAGNQDSGIIDAANGITSVTIGGSLIGGTGNYSGVILAESGNLGAVTIGRDLVGGGADNTTSYSGAIWAQSTTGNIAKITIGGSATGGASPNYSGAILAGQTVGPVIIGGDLSGNAPTVPFVIGGGGFIAAKGSTNVGIASVTVGGDVSNALIEAGFSFILGSIGSPLDGHVQIGAITVGGDWTASSVSAGIAPDSNGYFGTSGNAQIADGPAKIAAKIASIKIAGTIAGTSTPTSDNFGFVANQIGLFQYSGITVPLTAGQDAPVTPFTSTATGGDVTIREI